MSDPPQPPTAPANPIAGPALDYARLDPETRQAHNRARAKWFESMAVCFAVSALFIASTLPVGSGRDALDGPTRTIGTTAAAALPASAAIAFVAVAISLQKRFTTRAA